MLSDEEMMAYITDEEMMAYITDEKCKKPKIQRKYLTARNSGGFVKM